MTRSTCSTASWRNDVRIKKGKEWEDIGPGGGQPVNEDASLLIEEQPDYEADEAQEDDE